MAVVYQSKNKLKSIKKYIMNNFNCRVSGQQLDIVNDFGKQPLGNGFLKMSDFSNEYFFDMKTGFCKQSKMFQLLEQPNPKKMFHETMPFIHLRQ